MPLVSPRPIKGASIIEGVSLTYLIVMNYQGGKGVAHDPIYNLR